MEHIVVDPEHLFDKSAYLFSTVLDADHDDDEDEDDQRADELPDERSGGECLSSRTATSCSVATRASGAGR